MTLPVSDTRPRIAIVEDNADIREEIEFYLEAKGYATWGVESAEAFWRLLHGRPVDIVLIDVGLPGEDGFSVLEYLGELRRFGLIVISARGGRQDHLRGLDLGADFYFVKPLNLAALARAIGQLWQRLQAQTAQAVSPALAKQWELQNNCLHGPSGERLELSSQEARLLEVLLRHRNQLCSKGLIHDLLFGYAASPDLHRVSVVLSRLRGKADRQGVRLPVRTVFGKGMVFVDDAALFYREDRDD